MAMWASVPHTWRLSLASGWLINGAKYATAPASTTACASSGECLQMSPKEEAEMRLRVISGSWMHSTSNGTAPASTTACANSGVCCAM